MTSVGYRDHATLNFLAREFWTWFSHVSPPVFALGYMQGTTRHDREERGRRLEVVPAQPPPLMKYTAESGFLPPVCVPEYVSSSYNPVGSMFDPPLPKRDLLSAMSEIGFPDRVLRAITLDKVDTSTMSSLLRDLRAAKATRVFNERGRRFIGPKPSCYPSYMSGEGMAHLLGKVRTTSINVLL